jgi:hypothetical protein
MTIKIGVGAFTVIFVLGLMGFALAQDSSTTKTAIHNSKRALTGCLQKGDDGYVLTAGDGGTWELKGNRQIREEGSDKPLLINKIDSCEGLAGYRKALILQFRAEIIHSP